MTEDPLAPRPESRQPEREELSQAGLAIIRHLPLIQIHQGNHSDFNPPHGKQTGPGILWAGPVGVEPVHIEYRTTSGQYNIHELLQRVMEYSEDVPNRDRAFKFANEDLRDLESSGIRVVERRMTLNGQTYRFRIAQWHEKPVIDVTTEKVAVERIGQNEDPYLIHSILTLGTGMNNQKVFVHVSPGMIGTVSENDLKNLIPLFFSREIDGKPIPPRQFKLKGSA